MVKDMIQGQMEFRDWMPEACPADQPKQGKKRRLSEDEFALCPFYRKDGPVEIRCEGLCGILTASIFSTKAEKEQHMYDFCKGAWQGCPLYQALEIDAEG